MDLDFKLLGYYFWTDLFLYHLYAYRSFFEFNIWLVKEIYRSYNKMKEST